MDLIKFIILGVIQGLTEFLPVSSSGHMVLSSEVLNIMDQDASLEILLHMATLLSVIIYFRQSFIELIIGTLKNLPAFFRFAFFSSAKTGDKSELYWPYYSFYLIIASVPAGCIGVIYKDDIEALFSNPLITLVMLMITGIFLLLSSFAKPDNKPINGWRALVIGLAQAFAILPGISRSGSTIICGMFLGLRNEVAAKFSFFMSIPVILGAFILKIDDILRLGLNSDFLLAYSLAFIASFLAGYFAIYLVMNFIEKGKFKLFGYYCVLVSLGGLFYLAFN